MQALGQPDRDHLFGLYRIALGCILAAKGGDHFLQFGELGRLLELLEFRLSIKGLASDPVDPQNVPVEHHPVAGFREGLSRDSKDLNPLRLIG